MRKPDNTHQDIEKQDKARETPKAPVAETVSNQVSVAQNVRISAPFEPY